MAMTRFRTAAALGAVLLSAGVATAQQRSLQPVPAAPEPSIAAERLHRMSAVDWLQRMNAASSRRTYTGTFVVSAPTGTLSSARIWHACEGDVQVERIETLTGSRRSTFRRNDEVMTYLPEAGVVKKGHQQSLEIFPNLVRAPESAIDQHYRARVVGKDRVAGFDADVVQLEPRDQFRFGYRVWSERSSGLAVKLQTIDMSNRVVEQSAFSELQLDAPVDATALAQMMHKTDGYRVELSELQATSAEREGWRLREPVPGFVAVSCFRRTLPGAGVGHTMQWTFSDGLASVSLFVEPFDARRESREALMALGATYTMTRRLRFKDGSGDWWLTAVGEVPPQTLDAFAKSLQRRP